jgi:Tfp pilus assembly protein PilV
VTTAPGSYRLRHRAQGGLTLIEIIAALVLLTVGVLALIEGLAATQSNASISTDQAQLEASAREVGDYLRSAAVPYNPCDFTPLTPDQYKTAVTTGLGSGFSTKWKPTVIDVTEATGATVTLAGAATQTTVPYEKHCTTTSPGIGDWGAQRITFQLTSPSTRRTIVRAVFKWDSNPIPAP